jgi:hypothetical protein
VQKVLDAVLIAASIFTGYVEIQECAPSGGAYTGGALTGQGLNYQRADENYVNTYALQPGAILSVGNQFARNRSTGCPARTDADGSARPATPFIKVYSASGEATQVEVREYRQR